MSFFVLSPLINTITSALLILLLIFKAQKSKIIRSFIYFCLTVSLWSMSYFVWQLSSSAEQAQIWIKILMAFAILIPVFYLKFVVYFLEETGHVNALLYTSYTLAAFFELANYKNYFSTGVQSKMGFQFWPDAGLLFGPFLIFFFTLASFTTYLLIKHFAAASPVRRQQIKYIIAGLLIGFGGGATNYFLWLDIQVRPYGNIGVSFFILLVTYAIITEHLLDVRLVARKYFVYIAFITTITSMFVSVRYAVHFFIPVKYAQITDLVLLIISLLLASPLKNYYYMLANKHLFSSLYDPEDVIEEISNQLHATIDLQKICEAIYNTLKNNFHLKAMAILRLEDRSSNFLPLFVHDLIFPKNFLPNNNFLYDHFLSYNEAITTAQLKELEEEKLTTIIKSLEDFKIAVLVPLIIKNDVIGILALGDKESKDIFNEEDLRVLKIIAAQGATAIENARLYTEVQTFGTTLQKRVDEQTRDINAKAEHLKKLMEMRSEFLDITSHQLRTPVSVIKGVLSMLEEGSIPKDREKDFIKGAMEKSIKLGEIINDILRASEMDSDKFTMTIREVDLNEMLAKIKDDKRRSAEIKKLKFFMEVPVLPPVMTDPKYVEHAIVNLINNSIQYTVEGSITVTAEVQPAFVVIRVSDTGIGIPLEAQHKLFTKFSRAANAVTTFTDGTGLGLFIIKQIVDANPGAKIEIERTEINKGTTFAYWLPRAK
ncbi:MAG: ATP-binding protein [bacterium]